MEPDVDSTPHRTFKELFVEFIILQIAPPAG